MFEDAILSVFDGFKVALMPTTHFMKQQQERKFAMNVIAKATILAQSLAVGKELEVAVSSNGMATAIIQKTSESVAILKTGWAGQRKISKRGVL